MIFSFFFFCCLRSFAFFLALTNTNLPPPEHSLTKHLHLRRFKQFFMLPQHFFNTLASIMIFTRSRTSRISRISRLWLMLLPTHISLIRLLTFATHVSACPLILIDFPALQLISSDCLKFPALIIHFIYTFDLLL